jgi:hypothetical protein
MPIAQLFTQNPPKTEVARQNVKAEPLDENTTVITDDDATLLQESWVEFCARGGMLVGEDGNWKIETVSEFATQIGVSRRTLYNWKKSIPNFRERVIQRSREIRADPYRVNKVWNGLFLKGSSGDSKAAALYLYNNDENFKLPGQKLDDGEGGLADLMQLARKRARQQEQSKQEPAIVIEGEVVNDAASNNSQ